MPFCPKCRYEYRGGITECPDCGARLTEELSAETPVEEPPLQEPVRVLWSWNKATIVTAKCLLAGFGIWCYAKNELLEGLIGWGAIGANVAVGPVEIQVAGCDAKAAREILSDLAEATKWNPVLDTLHYAIVCWFLIFPIVFSTLMGLLGAFGYGPSRSVRHAPVPVRHVAPFRTRDAAR